VSEFPLWRKSLENSKKFVGVGKAQKVDCNLGGLL
jgi:hypothetical protein